jgi:hypothetical protein
MSDPLRNLSAASGPIESLTSSDESPRFMSDYFKARRESFSESASTSSTDSSPRPTAPLRLSPRRQQEKEEAENSVHAVSLETLKTYKKDYFKRDKERSRIRPKAVNLTSDEIK